MTLVMPPTTTTAADRRTRGWRRPVRPLTLLASTLLALLVLMACNGGDDDGGEGGRTSTTAEEDEAQAYVDAAAASLTADEELPFDQETATCVATALVDLIGADALARAGVSPQEFAEAETYDLLAVDVPDDAEARLSESLDDCDVVSTFTSMFAAELGVELPADAVACLDESVDRRAVTDAFASGLFAPSSEDLEEDQAGFQAALQTALVDAVVACPPVVTAMFLADAPGTVTPDTQACVSALVEANPARVRDAINGDTAAAEELGAEIGSTCSDTLAD
jgi:hypothetical protein